MAKLFWQMVAFAFGIPSIPAKLSDMMGDWIKAFPRDQRRVVLCGGVTICWTVWKARNRACFGKKNPDDPTSLVYRLCFYLNAWSILQKTQDKRRTELGVVMIKQVVE